MIYRIQDFVFLIYLLILSTLVGFVVSLCSPIFGIHPLALALAGASLTPHLIAFCTLLFLFLFPKADIKYLALSLLAAPSVFLYFNHDITRLFLSIKFIPIDYFALACFFIFIIFYLEILYRYSKSYDVFHDSNIYIQIAENITDKTSIKKLCNLTSTFPNFVVQPHGLSYCSFLCFSINFFQKDTPLNRHIQLNIARLFTHISLLISIFAIVFSLYHEIWIACCASMLSIYPFFYRYTVKVFSRDPYRMIPIWCLLLLASSTLNIASDNFIFFTLALIILTYVTGDAHAINLVFIGCFELAFVLAIPLYNRTLDFSPEQITCIALGSLGILLASLKHITAYRQTKNFWGKSRRLSAFDKMPAFQKMIQQASSIRIPISSLQQRLKHLVQNDWHISLLGMLCCFSMTLILFLQNATFPEVLITLTTLSIIIPYTGVFDSSRYQFSSFFAENGRYSLHCHVFLSICIAMLLFNLCATFDNYHIIFAIQSLLTGISFFTALYQLFHLQVSFCDNSGKFSHYTKLFNQLFNVSPASYSIAISNNGFPAPYLNKPLADLFSETYAPILSAPNPDIANLLLFKNKINIIILHKADIPKFFIDKLPFYTTLNANFDIIYSDDSNEIWRRKPAKSVSRQTSNNDA